MSHLLLIRNASFGIPYSEFIMARGAEKSAQEYMKTRRMRINFVQNGNFSLFTFTTSISFTKNGIPGASVDGRRPSEMKFVVFATIQRKPIQRACETVCTAK